MPTWGKILKEIQVLAQKKEPRAVDIIREKYLKILYEFTNRDTIIYATRWTSGDAPPNMVSINDEDVHAFMEALAGLNGNSLDLIIHTGGGSPEATDAIVSFLRQKYNDIRILIPQAAMSAGTMLACSADEIVMGKQSSIGPIDPQFILQTSVGIQALPAHAILKQFENAQKDCAENPNNLNSWMPMLSQYGPALLVRCKDQIDFGRDLVESWLTSYMFKDEKSKLPHEISKYLSDHDNFKTHGKHLNINNAKDLGLKIQELEANQEFQDKVLSAFHATLHAFGVTSSAKIIANHNGNSFVKHFRPPVRK
ncbi:MAG: serine protease [Planctomycetia bacterium]|nr:serine protease [Planctomycetia bacterium]